MSGSSLLALLCVFGVSLVLPVEGTGSEVAVVAMHLISPSGADLQKLPGGSSCWIVSCSSFAGRVVPGLDDSLVLL